MFSLRKTAFVVAALCTAAPLRAQQERAAEQIVQMRCTVCHRVDLLEQQRLTRPGWDREVAKMRAWGAAVDDSQAAVIAAHLANLYGPPGPKPVRVSDAGGAAADLLKTRCTVCHRTDLIEAQRLDATGWRRELAKMASWGAQLTPDETELLIAHLAP
jgi:cytochrome c5